MKSTASFFLSLFFVADGCKKDEANKNVIRFGHFPDISTRKA